MDFYVCVVFGKGPFLLNTRSLDTWPRATCLLDLVQYGPHAAVCIYQRRIEYQALLNPC